MRDADCQDTEGAHARGGPSVVVLSPTLQVLSGCQAATMFRPGANRRELDIRWRRCPLIRIPSPAGGGSAAERADMVPAGINGGELTLGRVKLRVIVLTPTADPTIGTDPASKSIASRDLLKLDVLWSVQLPVVIRSPTLDASARLEGARVVFADSYPNETWGALSGNDSRSGTHHRCGFGRLGGCGHGCRRSRPQPHLQNRWRPLSSRLRGSRRIAAGHKQECSENGRKDKGQATIVATLKLGRCDPADQPATPFKGSTPHGSAASRPSQGPERCPVDRVIAPRDVASVDVDIRHAYLAA